MKALTLARVLLLYPDANVLIDTMADKYPDMKKQPYRDIKTVPGGEANEYSVTLVVSEHGFGRR